MPSLRPAIALPLAVVGGLVLELAFPPQNWWPLALLAIALLHLALRGRSIAGAYLTAALFGTAFMVPHLEWAVDAVGGGSYLPWLALSFAQGLIIGLYGLTLRIASRWRLVTRWPALMFLIAPALWVAIETLRSLAPFGGFPWGLLAFSQVGGPLSYLAPLGGQVLVSAVVVALGLILVIAIDAAIALRPLRLIGAGAAVSAALVATMLLPTTTGEGAPQLRIGLVQGDVPAPGERGFARQVTKNHRAGTEQLIAEHGAVDLVLWPESSADIDPRTDERVAEDVDAAADAAGVPIILGTQRYIDSIRYNELIIWQPGSGDSGQAYAKQHPVPFGEYMPMRDFFRNFTDLVDLVTTDMVAGDQPGILHAPTAQGEVAVAAGICFEVGYADIVRESVAAGGQFLIIPTNNASHGHTQVSAQQFDMTRFRALEHGRAAIQVGTTGVSGVVMPDGEVVARTEIFTPAQLAADIPLLDGTTLATRMGWWPAIIAALLGAGGVIMGLVQPAKPVARRHTRKSTKPTKSTRRTAPKPASRRTRS